MNIDYHFWSYNIYCSPGIISLISFEVQVCILSNFWNSVTLYVYYTMYNTKYRKLTYRHNCIIYHHLIDSSLTIALHNLIVYC